MHTLAHTHAHHTCAHTHKLYPYTVRFCADPKKMPGFQHILRGNLCFISSDLFSFVCVCVCACMCVFVCYQMICWTSTPSVICESLGYLAILNNHNKHSPWKLWSSPTQQPSLCTAESNHLFEFAIDINYAVIVHKKSVVVKYLVCQLAMLLQLEMEILITLSRWM